MTSQNRTCGKEGRPRSRNASLTETQIECQNTLESTSLQWNLSRTPLLLCICILSTLICFNWDLKMNCSMWTLMTPIWVWFVYALISTLQECIKLMAHGTCSFLNWRNNVTAKLILAFGHCLLFCFCVLICINVETNGLLYVHAFIPLFIFCVVHSLLYYPLRNVRQPQLDDLIASNIITFILVSLRLDDKLSISWAVAFTPLWIIVSVLLVFLLYGCFLIVNTLCVGDSDPNLNLMRRTTVGYTIATSSFLTFLILLERMLDGHLTISSIYINIPFLISLITIMVIDFFVPSSESYFSLANCIEKQSDAEEDEPTIM